MGMRKGIATLALFSVFAISSARAQSPVTFDLGGGASFPLSDFASATEVGWHGLVGVSVAPVTLPVGFRVDGMFQRLNLEEDAFTPPVDGDYQIINGTGNVFFTFPTSAETVFRPYLIGGVGVYNYKTTGDDFPDLDEGDESETDFGLNAGAGFRFRSGAIGFFAEGRFHNVFADGNDLNLIPVTVGITLGGS